MKIYLAGQPPKELCTKEFLEKTRPYVLESFYYVNSKTKELLPSYGDFLLDSGAFTFVHHTEKTANWKEYVDRYAEFINENKIEKFFEMDIDSVVGYKRVLELRERLERQTGRQSIPVWHSNRGTDEFVKTCQEYPYVALGGIVGNRWRHSAEKYMPWFIKTAHKNGAKIHALGYTSSIKLPLYHFDSTDSSSWNAGAQYGCYWQFKDGRMRIIKRGDGYRLKDAKSINVRNYIEWIKFQKWAEVKL